MINCLLEVIISLTRVKMYTTRSLSIFVGINKELSSNFQFDIPPDTFDERKYLK